MSEILIGIDPDTHKSGVALYRPFASVPTLSGNFLEPLELDNLSFFELFDFLQSKSMLIRVVVIEAGWLWTRNWRKVVGSANINAKIGERTGANHETGKKIVEMCEYLGLKYDLVRPNKSKVDHKTFKQITNWKGRTNQEQRDAAMLVYGRKS